MGVNSLPKTVTRQRRGCDLNPGPSALESSTLTTRLPSLPLLSVFLSFTPWFSVTFFPLFPFPFYRAMLCIRGTSHGTVSVCPSVCPTQVGVLSKRLNESSWFLACKLSSTRSTLC